jgi:LemA protein
MIVIWIIIALLVVVAWVIYLFNALVGLTNRTDAAWADIDTLLKRRYDLIPNLIDVVRAHTTHENSTLEKLTAARAAGLQAFSPAEKSKTEPAVATSTHAVLALSESYPRLKASDEFQQFFETLINIENHLQRARRLYNAHVDNLNAGCATFPQNLFAPLFGVGPREYYQADNPAETPPPR